jgi:hypothetical protein
MKNKTVIRKAVSSPKLTIVADEIRIKIPLDTSSEKEQAILELFDRIIEDLPYEGSGIRGSFNASGKIRMYANKNQKFLKEYQLDLAVSE